MSWWWFQLVWVWRLKFSHIFWKWGSWKFERHRHSPNEHSLSGREWWIRPVTQQQSCIGRTPPDSVLPLGSTVKSPAWCEGGSVRQGSTGQSQGGRSYGDSLSCFPPWLFESQKVVCICIRLPGSNKVVFMNIISKGDQKIYEMYNTTSPMLLFEHKSTDNQHAAASRSLLRTVVHKSKHKQTPLLSTPASSGPVPKLSDKFMGL